MGSPLALRLGLLLLVSAGSAGSACSRDKRPVPAPEPAASTSASTTRAPEPSASAEAASKPEPDAPLSVPPEQRYEPRVDGEKRPLVVVLHGLGASGKKLFDALELARFGERERTFVLAPDGSRDTKDRRFWNADRACCNFENQPVDDVARLSALIERTLAEKAVDPRRVYVLGHSNGGFMAHRLACQASPLLAAVAGIASAGPHDDLACALTTPLAVLEIHGDEDDIVRYEGGNVFDSPELPRHLSAEGTLAGWGRRLGCRGKQKVAARYDLSDRLPGEETEARGFETCAGGAAELWTVHGGGHALVEPRVLSQVWRFFAAHPKGDGATSEPAPPR